METQNITFTEKIGVVVGIYALICVGGIAGVICMLNAFMNEQISTTTFLLIMTVVMISVILITNGMKTTKTLMEE